MREPSETTPGGIGIVRYPDEGVPPRPPTVLEHALEILAHVERHLGPSPLVLHEHGSTFIHVDIHLVPPTPARRCWMLVTSGMSAAPMRARRPSGEVGLFYAELCIGLPAEWRPPPFPLIPDPLISWPFALLHHLARLPHEFDSFLGFGHSVPNGQPPFPYGGDTRFDGAILLDPVLPPDDFLRLRISKRKEIEFLGVFPLYPEEMAFLLREGVKKLEKRLEQHGVTEVIDLNRPVVAT